MQVISNRQNMTVAVTEESVGTYYCHAEVAGYKTITSRPGADVLMTGSVKIPFARTELLIMNLQKHNPCISSLCLFVFQAHQGSHQLPLSQALWEKMFISTAQQYRYPNRKRVK